MDRTELVAVTRVLLRQAHDICNAPPGQAALAASTIADLPADVPEGDLPTAALRAALGYMREEMVAIRDGRVLAVNVLRDEIVCITRLYDASLVRPLAGAE